MPLEERNIDSIVFSHFICTTWYGCSGYFDKSRSRKPPLPACLGEIKKSENIPLLHICQFCFKYTVHDTDLIGHESFCSYKDAPPGELVYRNRKNSIYRVDGSKNKLYCQCLCLFAKLFLDNKSIYFSVDGFDFYVLTESVPFNPQRVVGFFSKEKVSFEDYNLACILVFPPFQKTGLGKLLIAFSYHLSRKDKKLGSPEKPLSVHGRSSYLSYWLTAIAQVLENSRSSTISIEQLATRTGILHGDIVEALNSVSALKIEDGDQVIFPDRVLRYIRERNIELSHIISSRHCIS